eukprot:13476988-Alexandrium_andersonii.AAC.1
MCIRDRPHPLLCAPDSCRSAQPCRSRGAPPFPAADSTRACLAPAFDENTFPSVGWPALGFGRAGPLVWCTQSD